MTRPMIYQHATEDFDAYLLDARDRLDTPSRNVAYTSTDGVFRAFRARLDPQDALRFADVLPAVLRAIFVADWDLADRRDWTDRETLTAEVKALRQHHNFSPIRSSRTWPGRCGGTWTKRHLTPPWRHSRRKRGTSGAFRLPTRVPAAALDDLNGMSR